MEWKPKIHPSVFVANSANIIGKVTIKKGSSVWYNCVIRSDYIETEVIIGEHTNIQDGTIIHIDSSNSTLIGNNVTIGHNCTIHGCSIGDNTLIGMGSVILSGARIGNNSVIAAGSVVKQNSMIENNTLYAGVPAKKIKTLTTNNIKKIKETSKSYEILAKEHFEEKYKIFNK